MTEQEAYDWLFVRLLGPLPGGQARMVAESLKGELAGLYGQWKATVTIRRYRRKPKPRQDDQREIPEDTPSLDTSFHDHEMDVD